jgi:hypothetical protein
MITFQDKVSLNTDPDIPEINKITDQNINDLKAGVNANETTINQIKGTILWTNPNPASSFASQTITLSSGDYDFYEVYFTYNEASAIHYANGFKSIKGKGLIAIDIGYFNQALLRRKVDYTDSTHLLISDGMSGGSVDNGYLIPIYVVGYKNGAFQ